MSESDCGGKVVTPRQAKAISLGGLGICGVGVVVACTVFLVPFWEAIGCFAIGAFFVLAFPWACLDRESRKRAFRAHNRFVYFFLALVVVTLIVQWGMGGKPFPMWAVGALIVGAVAAYSVMAYYAVLNFRRWRRGDFRETK